VYGRMRVDLPPAMITACAMDQFSGS
jgi:hypothetical protein